MAETVRKNLGMVTAYAYAVSKGYTGTEEEFAELMASYADVAQDAEASAQAAAQSATTAEQKATQAAGSAANAAVSATSASESAQAAAGSSNSASLYAQNASVSATSAAGSASSASSSAGSASASVQTAEGFANDAQTSATQAAGSATTATAKAGEAATSATTAVEAAQRAEDAAAVLVIDDTLTHADQAADAKKTGDEIGDLKENISYHQCKYINIVQGYWNATDGVIGVSPNWCRSSSFLPSGYIYRTRSVQMMVQAFLHDGTYIGTWDGTDFIKALKATGRYKVVDTTDWMSRYPGYKFVLTFYRGGSALTPADIYDELEIDFVSEAIYSSLGYKTLTFSSSGTAHSSAEDNIVLNISAGDSFYARADYDNALSGNGAALYVFYGDGTSESIQEKVESNKVYAFIAKKDIVRIGVYVAAQSSPYMISYIVANKSSIFRLHYFNFLSTEYNDENLDAKIIEYADLCKSNSIADTYMFFTDPHVFPHTVDEYRMERVFGTLERTFNSSPAQFVLCGGDWLLDSDTPTEAAYKLGRITGIARAKFGENYYPIIGNHDSNEQGTEELSQNALINLMFGEYGSMYYEFKTPNTRYYVFDTGSDHATAMTAYRWNQVDWYAKKLIEHDDAHSVIALHIFSGQANVNNFASDPKVSPIADNLTKIAQAYNTRTMLTLNGITYDFSGKSGKVSYLISGHTHYDATIVWNDIPCIVTKNAYYNPNFDLCYADYTLGKFKTIRIGNGVNRAIDIIT